MQQVQLLVGGIVEVGPAGGDGCDEFASLTRFNRHIRCEPVKGSCHFSLSIAVSSSLRHLDYVISRLLQNGHEKSFTARLPRQESVGREKGVDSRCDVPVLFNADGQSLCSQFLRYPLHIPLVFLGIERASRIDEQTARAQTGPDVAQNVALQSLASLHVVATPLSYRTGILTKHALARAGDVG